MIEIAIMRGCLNSQKDPSLDKPTLRDNHAKAFYPPLTIKLGHRKWQNHVVFLGNTRYSSSGTKAPRISKVICLWCSATPFMRPSQRSPIIDWWERNHYQFPNLGTISQLQWSSTKIVQETTSEVFPVRSCKKMTHVDSRISRHDFIHNFFFKNQHMILLKTM